MSRTFITEIGALYMVQDSDDGSIESIMAFIRAPINDWVDVTDSAKFQKRIKDLAAENFEAYLQSKKDDSKTDMDFEPEGAA